MPALTEERGSSSGLSLAIRLRGRDAAAWAELLELYGPLVDSWLARSGLEAAARDDIAQEVFLAVYRSIADFDASGRNATFRGWLWRITRNALLQHRRRREPAGQGGSTAVAQLAELVDPEPDGHDVDPPTDVRDTTLLLRRALEQIQDKIESRTWQAFWNTTVLGQSTAEVAQSLGVSQAAVRQAKSRTLHRLRQQMGDRP